MKTMRFFLATICCVAIFTACEKSIRSEVPESITSTIWGSYDMPSDSYETLTFSEYECVMRVIPAKEYRENPENNGSEEYITGKWSYTYTKPNVQLTPVDGKNDAFSGEIIGGITESLRIDLTNMGSFWRM